MLTLYNLNKLRNISSNDHDFIIDILSIIVLDNAELYSLISDSESIAKQPAGDETLKNKIKMLQAALPVLSGKLSSEIRLLRA